jgi:hypothetical protein
LDDEVQVHDPLVAFYLLETRTPPPVRGKRDTHTPRSLSAHYRCVEGLENLRIFAHAVANANVFGVVLKHAVQGSGFRVQGLGFRV